MTDVGELLGRNKEFARTAFVSGLTINPSGNLIIIGCVDPRVDPARIFDLMPGEAAVIRNVGGRVTPATLRTMSMLVRVGQANPAGRQPGLWNLVLLHHTDCGMTDLASNPEMLAEYFEMEARDLGYKSVSDPFGSVRVDVNVIRQNIRSASYLVSGLVYDVETGSVQTVVPPTPLMAPAAATTS